MFKILKKEQLTPESYLFDVHAPRIARKAHPGNFIMLRIDEKGERIPLTIADYDSEEGIVTIIFQIVGKTTKQLSLLNEGDYFLDFVGPLGKHMEVGKVGKVICIGGGLGVAPVYPKIKSLSEEGNEVISIIGARNYDLLILEDDIKEVSSETYITTDDGSYGLHGFVTDQLIILLEQGLKPDLIVAVGPVPMMKAVCAITSEHNIETLVSLDTIMVDGTGMCGSCRITVGGEVKFACVDGPMFNGHEVDFDEYSARQIRFCDYEKEAYEKFLKRCKCGGDE
jgi:ferredoxin--NADP+ reductase